MITQLYCATCLHQKLPDLNVEQDLMIQNIVDGCSGLLYLNLSCTLVTDVTIRELSRLVLVVVRTSYVLTCSPN